MRTISFELSITSSGCGSRFLETLVLFHQISSIGREMTSLMSLDVLVVEHQHGIFRLSSQNVGLSFHSSCQSFHHSFIVLLRAGDLGSKGRRNAGKLTNEGGLRMVKICKELSFVLNIRPDECSIRICFHYVLLRCSELSIWVIKSEVIVFKGSCKNCLFLR